MNSLYQSTVNYIYYFSTRLRVLLNNTHKNVIKGGKYWWSYILTAWKTGLEWHVWAWNWVDAITRSVCLVLR